MSVETTAVELLNGASSSSSFADSESASPPAHIKIEMQMACDRLQGSFVMFQYRHGGLLTDESLPGNVVEYLLEATAPNPFLNPPKSISTEDHERVRIQSTMSRGALGTPGSEDFPRIPQVTKPFRLDNQVRKIAANSSSMSQRYEQRCSALVLQWCRLSQQKGIQDKGFESEKLCNFTPPRSVVEEELSSAVVAHFLNVPIEHELLRDLFTDLGATGISAVSAPSQSVKVTFGGIDSVQKLLNDCTYNKDYGFRCNIVEGRRNIKVQIIPYWTSLSIYQRYSWLHESQILEPICHVRGITVAITAQFLAARFESLFGPVLFAKIFLDDVGFPTGWGCVVFRDRAHYNAALRTGLISYKCQNLRLSMETVPPFEREPCSYCFAREGVIFCRQTHCFTFYCFSCFVKVHDMQQLEDISLAASDDDTHRVYLCKNENEVDKGEL